MIINKRIGIAYFGTTFIYGVAVVDGSPSGIDATKVKSRHQAYIGMVELSDGKRALSSYQQYIGIVAGLRQAQTR